ncbi:MAG: helix-turn-helix domain-containing protein [Mycoplasmatota bacterium]
MNTVNKNNNITKRKVQDLLEKEYKKIGISNENVNKILKSMKSRNISVAMRTIFYNECMKKVQGEKEEKISRYSRITSMERISIEVLYSAGFKVNFIAVYIGKHRSTIKREIDKNLIEYWDVNSTKSPYKNQGQENKRYYSASKAQKRASCRFALYNIQ